MDARTSTRSPLAEALRLKERKVLPGLRGVMSKVTRPTSGLPLDQPRWCRLALMGGMWRKRESRGKRIWIVYSKEGEEETLVPPVRVRRRGVGWAEGVVEDGEEGKEKSRKGRRACRIRKTEPGVESLISVSRRTSLPS